MDIKKSVKNLKSKVQSKVQSRMQTKHSVLQFSLSFLLVLIAVLLTTNKSYSVPVFVNPKGVNPETITMAAYIKLRNSKVPVELAVLISKTILDTAEVYNFSPFLLNGLIEKESLYDPFAISSAGARGLTQVLIEDGVEIDGSRVYDIKYNIEKGAEILLSKLTKTRGDMYRALSNYSGGAVGYADSVYQNIGRYVVYRENNINEDVKVLESHINKSVNKAIKEYRK